MADSIKYRGDDAEWVGRKFPGTIYGEGTAQPLDNWDCNERGVREVTVRKTRRGVAIEEAGLRHIPVPDPTTQQNRGGMRRFANPGRPPGVPGPQSWADEDER